MDSQRKYSQHSMKPDFLCIGSRRSGTTWLYRNLRQSPSIWMPPVKSIRYFNRYGERMPLIVRVMFSHKRATQRRWQQGWRSVLTGRHAVWYTRYFFLPRSDEWYRSLFEQGETKISGEVCHSYGCVEDSMVSHVAELLPNLKILLFIRNPMERLWSEANLHARRQGQAITDLPDAKIWELLNRFANKSRHNDLAKLQRWQGHFSASQIFVSFFDQLQKEPAQLLLDVQTFLGVPEPCRTVPLNVGQKVGTKPYMAMPERFAFPIAQIQYPYVKALHHYFDNQYTGEWIRMCECLLNKAV